MSMTLVSEVNAARGGSKSSASLSCHIVLKPQAGTPVQKCFNSKARLSISSKFVLRSLKC